MSFITDQIRQIDATLDRIPLSQYLQPSDQDEAVLTSTGHHSRVSKIERVVELQRLIKGLSTTASPSKPLASVDRILWILGDSKISTSCPTCESFETPENSEISELQHGGVSVVSEDAQLSYEHELEWLLLSKAAAQTYGQVLNAILEQTLALNTHLSYWDDILGSHRYAGLYSIQTSPIRLWAWSKAIIFDVRSRQGGLSEGWRQFYGLVQDAVRERSIADLQARAVSPLSKVRIEARQKQKELKQIKEVNANALGVLLGEGLGSEDEGISTPVAAQGSIQQHGAKWKTNVAKSIVLMEAVLSHTKDPEADVETFEEHISSATREDHYYSMERNLGLTSGNLRPSDVSVRLQSLLRSGLPEYMTSFQQMLSVSGQPSRLVRYWLPATVLVLSSSTVLRIAVNRKAEILTWIQEFGATVRDFWTNWVVEPTRKVIGTIRHDEGSEVAIMSRRSLEGDRESLERMVVEFAVDENKSLSEVQIRDIKAKVQEGDLTAVLMAYEKDLKRPFLGAVRGNLIRALLIQIQKTKVDVEVAMGGIDSLLKSQELVFGFVGLTPGVLVTVAVFRWVNSTFVNRKGTALGQKKGEILHVLRNIDRALNVAQQSDFGQLYYKDYGLLLCECHVLRQVANNTLPGRVFREFCLDIEELTDIKIGVKRQKKVVKRIRWGYSQWF